MTCTRTLNVEACLAEAGGEGGLGGFGRFKNLGDCVVLLPVIALLTVVPIIAILAVRLFGLAPSADDLWLVAGFAVASAALIGLPALRWAMEHGRTRVVHLGVIGALAGVVAPLIVLVSGIVGQAAHGGIDYTRWVLAHGASVPWYGVMRWSSFSALAGECAAIGAVSGAVMTVFMRR